MIAAVILHKTYEEILSLLDDPWIDIAEIRLDLCDLTDGQIEDIFANTDTPLIATCRIAGAQNSREGAALSALKNPCLTAEECERRLSLAIRSGARYADLEIEAPADFSKRFRELCEECGCEIIRSYHNFESTPSLEELQLIKARCYRYGADIAKIATFAASPQDCEKIASLYKSSLTQEEPQKICGAPSPSEGRLIAFAMGAEGRNTRLNCLKWGAPFTYASLGEGQESAPGQYGYEQMHRELYGAFKGFRRLGDLPLPASKSFAQRAIVAAALAEGRSHLKKYTSCDDSEAAIGVAQALGAKITRRGSTLVIDGAGGGRRDISELDCGESGLLARLCIPLMAAINSGSVQIKGQKTLLKRPLKGLQDIMASFGVAVRKDRLPLEVAPPLIAGNAQIDGSGGSQLISGLMMALPLCSANSKVYVSEPKSIPYMFITQDIAGKFGIKIKSEMEGDERLIENQDWNACTQISFSIKGGQAYRAADIELEADWSAAACFMTAGAIFGKVDLEGLRTDSLQADLAIADILVQAGALVSETDGAVCVSAAPLEAFEADLGNSPDLFPICAVLAAFCDGQSVLYGVDRLLYKESNRAEAVLEMLSGFGVPAAIEDNALIVCGETFGRRLSTGNLLRGGVFRTHDDHRLAMALKIASMGAREKVIPDNPDCVSKSCPGFYELFDY